MPRNRDHSCVPTRTSRPGGGGKDEPGGGRRRLRPWRLILAAFVWALFFALLWLLWIARDLPDISHPPPLPEPARATVLAVDGSVLTTYGPKPGRDLAPEEIPEIMVEAVVATEDRRFFHHHGIDPVGIARAVWANLAAGRLVEGGSTITQQLAKNLFLDPERSLARKMRELLLALYLEQKLTKPEILALYLNRVYFGAGAYGLDAAARTFFGHGAGHLDLGEAALLAGLLKAPSRLQPLANLEGAWERARRVVLPAMRREGFITEEQLAAALEAGPPRLAADLGAGVRYASDRALLEAERLTGGWQGSVTILTTIRPDLQRRAEAVLRRVLDAEGDARGARQGAVVAMLPDGAIEAYVGGRDWRLSQFDRAGQARRQPGSAMKPFLYAAALEAGVRPDDVLPDAPITVGDWSPKNFDGRYRGPVALREAFVHSLNSVAVRLILEVGPEAVVAMARRLGLEEPLQPSAVACAGGAGGAGSSISSRAYAPFENGGYAVDPYMVLEVRAEDGPVLYRYRPADGGGARALGGGAGDDARSHAGGGGGGHRPARAACPALPAGGKTGTTQDFRDAVFVGFIPDHVAGVWVGNDDNAPMKGVTGGSLPAAIWRGVLAPLAPPAATGTRKAAP
ncbi:MAG: hypothetical protein KatS3mg119_0864 [Rhodothalassiaceae bacterium]|nr:MAG: hypothetical protein KatS3mg119_0864 [Rhodothalassiaceae bacterium]